MLPTTKTYRIIADALAAAGPAGRVSRPLAGALACTWVIAGTFAPAAAGTIQRPIAQRIMADSLAAAGHPEQAKALLRNTEPVLGPDGRITVRVILDSVDGGAGGPIVPLVNDAPPAWLMSIPTCCVQGSLGPHVGVRIAPGQVRALAAHPGVLYVGLSPRPVPLFESEGLAGMRVPEFWSRYRRGDGVRVGILDVGFANYERLLGSELPAHVEARAFWNEGSGPDITGGNQNHGTACAEIVHDVAPGAELYLANAGSREELRQAVTWLIEQGVEVISQSLAWPYGGGDGTGPIHDLVRLARQNGVVWVNAAGNFAHAYWGGHWSDPDSNGVLNVDQHGGEAILLPTSNAGPNATAWLTWDRWPLSTGLDFQIDLLAPDGALLATSQSDWADDPEAFRPLRWNGSTDLSGSTIRIRCLRGDPRGRFLRVTRIDNLPGHDNDLAPRSRVPEGSLAMPADSPDAIAVGAYAWGDRSLEPFSSYGPTLDGRAKPEILGPDRAQNSVTDPDPFSGTSAACPHVAGAIALLLGAGPRGGLFDARPDPAQVVALLKREAEPLPQASPPLPAGATGWGSVRLPVQQTKSDGPQLLALGNGIGPPILRLERAPRPILYCQVFDLQGRLVGRLEGASKGNGAIEFAATPLTALRLARGLLWAREPITGAHVSFLWPGSAAR